MSAQAWAWAATAVLALNLALSVIYMSRLTRRAGRACALGVDEYGCPLTNHHAVDCPADACRFADGSCLQEGDS